MRLTSEKQIVLVPKGAVDPEKPSRNGDLLSLLKDAGYDKFANGLGRNDAVEQGDYRFEAVKGARALAIKLKVYKGRAVGILMGSDVLAEADLEAEDRGVRSAIQRLVTLNLGQCSLLFLTATQAPLQSASDLEGRQLFTKYPLLLERVLHTMRIRAGIDETDGADTRLAELRDQNPDIASYIAAYEVVGTGKTALENHLDVARNLAMPSGADMRLPYLSSPAVATDMFVTNVRAASSKTRGALRRLGLSIESVTTAKDAVQFTFNVPLAEIDRYRGLGMKGPTRGDLLLKEGEAPWVALTIAVPIEHAPQVNEELRRCGVDHPFRVRVKMEGPADASEVLSLLPFDDDSHEREATERPNTDQEVERMTGAFGALETVILDRAHNPRIGSGTSDALQKGARFCASTETEEVAELSRALREESDENVAEEAADMLYRLLVALRFRDVDLEVVFRDQLQNLQVAYDCNESATTVFLRTLCEAVDNGPARSPAVAYFTGFSGQGIKKGSVALTDQALQVSRAVRKGEAADVLREAGALLSRMFVALRLRGVSFAAVADALRKRT